MFNVLILCTGNSARSILAEAIFNRDGVDWVKAYSAGSNPTGVVNPAASRLLATKGLPTLGYRSKSWLEFAAPGAPEMDLVITVCASAAGEICPIWPGAPLTCHWGVDDPANAPPDLIGAAFQIAYHRLSTRINAFLALPFETLTGESLKAQLDRIGRE
ncbi:MAG TPA: arsenate reductase ArsC [Thermohalobaculum sp.]|nr:arsenate reductase ArsC [Thermohalobaculum sp.]